MNDLTSNKNILEKNIEIKWKLKSKLDIKSKEEEIVFVSVNKLILEIVHTTLVNTQIIDIIMVNHQ